ncbi:MAG: sugar ABC transporter permease [Caldilineaceae bacterium]|nr:sugar ABC transporter permease [Caldilineaceae bacterium]
MRAAAPTFSLWSPKNRHLFAYLLLLPALLLTASIIIYPIASAIDLSFQDVKISRVGRERTPWTFDNYEKLFKSDDFYNSAWVTAKLVTLVTAFSFILGLATALLVNQRFHGRTAARLLVALPWAIPSVVATVAWWWMFDSSFGLINWVLVRTGLSSETINWLSRPGAAFFVIVVVMVWKGYPFVSVMLLAGLQAIPQELYDAAHVDGANAWNRFRYITMPGLRSVRGIALILILLWGFREFEIIYILTGGGPLRSTETLAIMTYLEAFQFFRVGYGAAIGIVTLIIAVIASIFMIRSMSDSVY